MRPIVKAFDEQTLIFHKDRNYLINPLTDHVPETSYEILKDAVDSLVALTDFSKATKIVGEEERGGFFSNFSCLRD